MKEIFKDAKIGDEVWDFVYGEGTITEIESTEPYPIVVQFKKHSISYTYYGSFYENSRQTLFWQKFDPPEEAYQKPFPDLKIDTRVLVWNEQWSRKLKRHFSHFSKNKKIVVFTGGSTSWNQHGTKEFDNWELAEE